jgi:hypothetical protein
MGMGEKPIPKGPSLFIQVFCLGDEIQFGDVYPGGTNHIAEMAANTKIDPAIHRGITWPSESFSTRTCLLGPGKEGGDPGNRTDRHTGGASDTNIGIIFRPTLIFHLDQ